jgi:hypothetical protein
MDHCEVCHTKYHDCTYISDGPEGLEIHHFCSPECLQTYLEKQIEKRNETPRAAFYVYEDGRAYCPIPKLFYVSEASRRAIRKAYHQRKG